MVRGRHKRTGTHAHTHKRTGTHAQARTHTDTHTRNFLKLNRVKWLKKS